MPQFDRETFLKLAARNQGLDDDESGDDSDSAPYSSLARDGAPPPMIQPDLDGEAKDPEMEAEAPPIPEAPNPLDADPMMQKYEQDQSKLSELRDAHRGATALANIGAAAQQIAQGANKPVPNEALAAGLQKSNDTIVHGAESDLNNRARVIKAIEDRKLRAAMAGERSEDRKLKENALQFERDTKREEKQQKIADDLRTPFGQANTAEDAKKLKSAYEAKANFDAKVDEMISLREKHGGGTVMDREDVARGKQLSKDLLLAYKDMAKLGVLSQSDEKILNQIIPPDPLAYSFAPGQDPIMSNLKKFKSDSDRDFKNRVETRVKERNDRELPGVASPKPPIDIDAKIDAFMEKNGIKDRDEAIKILKEHGKI